MPDELNIDELNEDEQAMVELVRDFVNREVRPAARELEHANTYPDKLIEQMKQLGIYGLAIPEPWGDAQVSTPCYARITEELSRGWMSLAGAMGGHTVVAKLLLAYGTDEQKDADLPRMATGELRATMALTEPGGGSDLQALRTTARRDGDDYVLNGQKTWITNGPHADTIVCYAKLDDGTGLDPRRRPVVTFILSSDMDGLERSAPLRKMGQHASPTGQLFFSDVRVGRDRLLGGTEAPRGGGRESAKDNFVTERAGVAAMALGIIEECLRLSIDYAKSRTLWERPISEFQLIQLKLARMEIARLNVENLVFRHIEMSSAGQSLTLAEASAMKLYSAQAASEVAMEAVQLFGGNGYMAEFRVEQLARDAKVFQIYAGTDEIQVTHIARDLLSR